RDGRCAGGGAARIRDGGREIPGPVGDAARVAGHRCTMADSIKDRRHGSLTSKHERAAEPNRREMVKVGRADRSDGRSPGFGARIETREITTALVNAIDQRVRDLDAVQYIDRAIVEAGRLF